TEATHAVVRWCFDNLDLHRVQADCTAGNIASERVLEKVGFTYEGTWRESVFEHGRFVDIKQYGLLRREYVGE
ncbi:MAG: GNAT family N-acetyltransferase, partial [Anaerolineae bacterium]|nr:GNAT family N-acetyltransferase [Anaerolineae bacterium]